MIFLCANCVVKNFSLLLLNCLVEMQFDKSGFTSLLREVYFSPSVFLKA